MLITYFCISSAVFMTLMLTAKLCFADIRSTIPSEKSARSGLQAWSEVSASAGFVWALSS